MKPNQHWALHIPDQLRDFGPVYGFWVFLGERLNKHFKNFNSNSHKYGKLEISMLRMFTREAKLNTMVSEDEWPWYFKELIVCSTDVRNC